AWNGNPQKLDWWSIKKNGEIFPKELIFRKGSYFGKEVIIAEGRDISERINAQKIASEKEKTLSMVLDNINYLTYSSDIIGKKIVLKYISPQVEKILGFKKEDFIYALENGKLIKNYHPEDLNKINDALKFILDSKQNVSVNYRFKHKLTGKYIWLEESVFPRFDDSGERIGNFGILKDVTERINAEVELKKSEEQYRLIFQNSLSGVFHSSLSGKILDCNQAFVEIFGFNSVEEIKEVNLIDLYINPGERKAYIENLLLKKELHNYELKNKKKDGTLLDILANITLIEGENPEIYGNIINITDRKKSENLIRESEKRFKLLSECAIEGIVISKNQQIIDCNNCFFELYEYASKEEVIGLNVANFIHPDYLQVINDSNFINERNPIEIIGITKNKKEIFLELRGMNIPFHGEEVRVTVIYDITERKKAELNLKENERALSTLLGNLPGMAYRCKFDEMWTMEFISEGCKDLTAYKPEDLLNNKKVSFNSIIDPKDKVKISKIIKSAVQARDSYEIEYRIITAKGDVKWMWEQGEGLFNEQGDCLYLEGFITDISERKEYESLIRQSRKSFKDLVDYSPVGVIILQSEKIVFANPCAKLILENNNEIDQGKFSFFDFVLPDYHQVTKDIFKKIQNNIKLPFSEIKLRGNNGHGIEVEINGTLTNFLGKSAIQIVCNDISYRKELQKEQLRAEVAEETTKKLQLEISERIKAEGMLLDNQKFTRSIIDSSLDIIVATDENNNIIEFNDAAEEAFGYTFEELKGKSSLLLFSSSKDHYYIEKSLKKVGKFSGEISNIRKGGAVFTSYISASILSNESGEQIGSMGVSRDISEMKLEEDRKETQYAISRILSEANDFSEAAPAILNSISFGFGIDFCEIWLVNEEEHELEYFSSFINPGAKISLNKSFERVSKKLKFFPKSGFPGEIWSKGKPLWINDLSGANIFTRKKQALQAGFTSAFGFPIKNGKNIIGVACFFHCTNIKENYNLLNLFSAFGSQIGQFIVKKKAETELRASEEKFKAIYNVAAVGIAKLNKKGKFIQVNQRLSDIFDLPEQGFYKKNIFDFCKTSEKRKIKLAFDGLLTGKYENYTSELFFCSLSGNMVFINLSLSVVNDENENPDYLVSVFEDITARKKSEEKVYTQAAKLNSIFESSSHQIWTLDKDYNITSFNKNYETAINSFLGIQPEIGMNLLSMGKESFASEPFGQMDKYYAAAFEGIPQHFEIPVTQIDGKELWLETFLNPIRLKKGKIEEISCIAQDVTSKKLSELQIKKSLKEKEVLLKEVHHRVKNNLQVISSILNLQSSNIKEKKILNILRESQDRIKAMAYIHESLYQNKDFSNIKFSDYIGNLSKNLVYSYRIYNNLIELKLDIDEVYLNLDLAIPCGLIINELVSNALKYAFPRNKKGSIFIKVKVVGDSLAIVVKDNGIGFPEGLDFRKTDSLGLQLVTTLTDQIQGNVEMETLKGGGTSFIINFKPIKTK
ncbi:MAG: PAS domain S-box protein, partial [Bacteroidetes bacterium]|nr:PAS domain S-box protein [Bacteroidota bacterium]